MVQYNLPLWYNTTYPGVNYFLEVHADGTGFDGAMILTVVDQDADFLRSDLVGTVTKHKQHGVNDV